MAPHRSQQSRYTSYHIGAPALTSLTSAPTPLSPRPQHPHLKAERQPSPCHSFFQHIVLAPEAIALAPTNSFFQPIVLALKLHLQARATGESIPRRHQIAGTSPSKITPLSTLHCNVFRDFATFGSLCPQTPLTHFVRKTTSPSLAAGFRNDPYLGLRYICD